MKVSEDFHAIEPITSSSEKGAGEGESRRNLSQMFSERDKLTEKIHIQIQSVLAEEYYGASSEVKESVLRINEKIITNLL